MRITINIEQSHVAQIDAMTSAYRTRSDVIREAILQHLAQAGPVDSRINGWVNRAAPIAVPFAKPSPEPVQLTRFTTVCGACHIGDHADCDQNKLPIICPCPCDGGSKPIAPKPRTKLVPLGNGLVGPAKPRVTRLSEPCSDCAAGLHTQCMEVTAVAPDAIACPCPCDKTTGQMPEDL
jgi:hypothetical protein